nr:hypothetical protein [Tsuneonella flava]
MQRGAGLFERCANGRVKMVAAPLARISALRFNSIPIGWTLTGRTFEALPKPNLKKVVQASFIIWIAFEELGDGLGLRHASFYAMSGYVWKGDNPQYFGHHPFAGRKGVMSFLMLDI